MKEKKSTPVEERVKRGQSAPFGDTGEGDTGVAADEQGISNRPGDRAQSGVEPTGDREDLLETEAQRLATDADDEDEDELEDEEDDDDVSEPKAEPGKPI